MSVVRGPNPTKNFTMIHNAVLRDTRLSWRARGLLVFILSQKEGYRTRSEDLAELGVEGREAVRAALRELEALTYLVRDKTRRTDGTFSQDVIVHSYPQDPAHRSPETRLWLDLVEQHESPVGTKAQETGVGFSGANKSTIGSTKRNDPQKFKDPAEEQAAAARIIQAFGVEQMEEQRETAPFSSQPNFEELRESLR